MLNTHYLIQLDCMYRKGKLTEGTSQLIRTLDRNGLSYTILTEQTAYSREQIASNLQEAGLLYIRPEDIYTSTMAACDYVFHAGLEHPSVYAAGSREIRHLIDQVGLHQTSLKPDYIFLGLDKEMSYEDYCDLLDMIASGAVLLSLDSREKMKTDQRLRIGSAAIARMLECASGTDAVPLGRGSELLWRWVLNYIRKTAADVTAVGNQFRKDIVSASRLGMTTVYLADENTDGEELMASRVHPDYIVETLAGLAR